MCYVEEKNVCERLRIVSEGKYKTFKAIIKKQKNNNTLIKKMGRFLYELNCLPLESLEHRVRYLFKKTCSKITCEANIKYRFTISRKNGVLIQITHSTDCQPNGPESTPSL